MEVNNFLPQSQHGFRPHCSTMTALAELQQKWAKNTEAKEVTGILLWDLLSSAKMIVSNVL